MKTLDVLQVCLNRTNGVRPLLKTDLFFILAEAGADQQTMAAKERLNILEALCVGSLLQSSRVLPAVSLGHDVTLSCLMKELD